MANCLCIKGIALCIGALMIVGGILAIIFADKTYNVESLVIKPGTKNYKEWIVNKSPIYTHFKLFNWTNPDEFNITGTKPRFVEMGPYVFLQRIIKQIDKFNTKGTSVSYNQTRIWVFDPKTSKGSLDDMVTAPHVVTASMANIMRNQNTREKESMNKIMIQNGGKLAATHKVHEMIFDGYNDQLLNALRNQSKINYNFNKFGYFVGRNASTKYDGKFTIDTGTDRIQKLGNLTHWNDKINNGFYPGECGKINGSAGDLFPPYLDKTNKSITIFSADVCRYLNLSPNRTVQTDGVNGFEWIGTAETLDSGSINPNKKCFCSLDRKECPMTGVVDCRLCHNDWPIFASFPHFYLADPQYRHNISGMKPSKKKHQYSYVLESNSGRVLKKKARIQMNLLIQRDDSFDFYKNIADKTMFPLYFTEEKAVFKGMNESLEVKPYWGFVLVTCGCLIVFVCCILYLESTAPYYRSGYEPIPNAEGDNYSHDQYSTFSNQSGYEHIGDVFRHQYITFSNQDLRNY